MSDTETTPRSNTRPVDPAQVHAGDLMSMTRYFEVLESTRGGHRLKVRGVDHGGEFYIDGADLVAGCYSGSQILETQRTTRTVIGGLLRDLPPNAVATVYFKKQDGDMRTMKCRVLGFDNLGYLVVEDLALPTSESRQRRVDLRTVEWAITGGVKYEVR